MGTNGSPQEGQAARQRQSRHAMPAAPGMPRAAPSDPGHGGEGADDGCAGIMPTARWPGSGEPGGRRVPGRVSHPARTRSRASTGTRCAHQRRIRDGARPGQRHLAGVPGRRLMPAAQPARSAGTPPGDDDLDAAAAHPGQGGGRQPALPAGQQPARGTLATGHGGHAARRPGERQGLPRPGSTTGTDPGRGWTAPSPVPKTAHGKPADRAGKTGHSLASPSAQPPPGCSLMHVERA